MIKKDTLVFTGSFIDFLAHLVTAACYRVTAYFANIPFVKVCIYNGINDYCTIINNYFHENGFSNI